MLNYELLEYYQNIEIFNNDNINIVKTNIETHSMLYSSVKYIHNIVPLLDKITNIDAILYSAYCIFNYGEAEFPMLSMCKDNVHHILKRLYELKLTNEYNKYFDMLSILITLQNSNNPKNTVQVGHFALSEITIGIITGKEVRPYNFNMKEGYLNYIIQNLKLCIYCGTFYEPIKPIVKYLLYLINTNKRSFNKTITNKIFNTEIINILDNDPYYKNYIDTAIIKHAKAYILNSKI